jgi:hypothetical protein
VIPRPSADYFVVGRRQKYRTTIIDIQRRSLNARTQFPAAQHYVKLAKSLYYLTSLPNSTYGTVIRVHLIVMSSGAEKTRRSGSKKLNPFVLKRSTLIGSEERARESGFSYDWQRQRRAGSCQTVISLSGLAQLLLLLIRARLSLGPATLSFVCRSWCASLSFAKYNICFSSSFCLTWKIYFPSFYRREGNKERTSCNSPKHFCRDLSRKS